MEGSIRADATSGLAWLKRRMMQRQFTKKPLLRFCISSDIGTSTTHWPITTRFHRASARRSSRTICEKRSNFFRREAAIAASQTSILARAGRRLAELLAEKKKRAAVAKAAA